MATRKASDFMALQEYFYLGSCVRLATGECGIARVDFP